MEFLRKSPELAKLFFVVFYFIGFAGLAIPLTFPLFVRLTPVALMISFFALMVFHQGRFDFKTIAVFGIIYFLSFTIEAIGVATGSVFGEYQYGTGLGAKIFETPLIIGVNWILLVYTSSNIAAGLNIKTPLQIVIASGVMLMYDFVLEQLAPKLNMWQWKDDVIPTQNYLAWFILAIVFHTLIKVFQVQTENKIAKAVFLCQFFFFVALYLFYYLVI
jgi:bisanhydrobacterioruberin hydratase